MTRWILPHGIELEKQVSWIWKNRVETGLQPTRCRMKGKGEASGLGSGSRCVGAIQIAKFKGFTRKAIEAIMLAREECRQIGDREIDGHDYIGPGHLLIGMLRRPEGYATNVLGEYLGVDFKKIYTQVIPMVGEDIECAGLGATTIDEYREHIRKDPPLVMSFLSIQVPEPSVEETILILRGLKEHYEN
ncbi:hypothetical protein V6N13_086250 [Hibiscus sabdariffa]